MSFLRIRNGLMLQHGWDRQVATLAARLYLGVDTRGGIKATPSFLGRPLLSHSEWAQICHVGPSETEEVAPSDTGAGSNVHPTFNVKGTQTGRLP